MRSQTTTFHFPADDLGTLLVTVASDAGERPSMTSPGEQPSLEITSVRDAAGCEVSDDALESVLGASWYETLCDAVAA